MGVWFSEEGIKDILELRIYRISNRNKLSEKAKYICNALNISLEQLDKSG